MIPAIFFPHLEKSDICAPTRDSFSKTFPLEITFLGTGTSQGVPVIGCDCEVCRSEDPKDKRLRSSVLISEGAVNVVIDVGPDFRQQMLREGTRSLQAVLLTHEHNDHTAGLDDLRPFNFIQREDMPLYASRRVLDDIVRRFTYVFEENPYPGAPMIDLRPISKEKNFAVGGMEFIPIEVMHGTLPILGFRTGDFTYLTDVKTVEDTEMEKIIGTKILVLNALHHQRHFSHLNLEEALEFIQIVQPEQAYLTHLSHRMGLHVEVSKKLPSGVALAFDGLKIYCS